MKVRNPRTTSLYKALSKLDGAHGDVFELKSGGEGDNGEHLMDLLDLHFDAHDERLRTMRSDPDIAEIRARPDRAYIPALCYEIEWLRAEAEKEKPAWDGTGLDIAPIRARAEKAEPGPWVIAQDGDITAPNAGYGLVCNDARPRDAVFISSARTDVPALCDEIERLRAKAKVGNEMSRLSAWIDALCTASLGAGLSLNQVAYVLSTCVATCTRLAGGDAATTAASVQKVVASALQEGEYRDECFCDHCEKDTDHLCYCSGHERDSSGDWRQCLVCNYRYSGFDGKYHAP